MPLALEQTRLAKGAPVQEAFRSVGPKYQKTPSRNHNFGEFLPFSGPLRAALVCQTFITSQTRRGACTARVSAIATASWPIAWMRCATLGCRAGGLALSMHSVVGHEA